jgi:methyl-accepting chemotaxis protein
MKWLGEIKIGPRLAAGFGTTLVLVGLMGGLSVLQSSKIHDGTTDIATNWLPSVQVLGDLNGRANDARRATMGYALVDTADAKAARAQSYADGVAQYAAVRKAYEPMISSPEERQLVNSIDAAWNDFGAANAPILKLGTTNADIQAAHTLVEGAANSAFTRLEKAIGSDIELNRKGSEEASASASNAYHSSLIVTLALIAVALMSGIAVAILIARSIVMPIKTAVSVAETVASGDLTSQIHVEGRDETSDLLRALQVMSGKLANLVGSVRQSSESIATGSSEIAAGNTDLSQRTEEQAAALEETAASMEQLTATVRQNAENAKQGNTLAQDASAVASKGGSIVDRVIATMQDIQSRSEKVSDIISVIDGIAFQTNILALNAAVEAARAGEQGRGFAVVAGEVRTLAQRSAAAAKEIKDLIDQSVTAVKEGSTLVNEAGVTMHEVVRSVAKVTDLMAEISASAAEQHTGIEQVNQAVMQMDEVTQQNAALVEEASAAAQSMAAQSSSLKEIMATFRLTEHDTRKMSGSGDLDFANHSLRAPVAAGANTVRIAHLGSSNTTSSTKPKHPALAARAAGKSTASSSKNLLSSTKRPNEPTKIVAGDAWESF